MPLIIFPVMCSILFMVCNIIRLRYVSEYEDFPVTLFGKMSDLFKNRVSVLCNFSHNWRFVSVVFNSFVSNTFGLYKTREYYMKQKGI